MHQPIPNSCFADYPMLWVIDLKRAIWLMAISMVFELGVKRENIVFQISLKPKHVGFAALASAKFLPTINQILKTNKLVKHMTNNEIPIIVKLSELYKSYYQYLELFPKKDKHSIGIKCEGYIIATLELLLEAGNVPKEQKLALLKKANVKFDALKFFLRTARELKILDNKKYLVLQTHIQEIGRMLGGWLRSLTSF